MKPAILKHIIASGDFRWPTFTETQVAFLEEMYPARCLATNESVEDHLRYAGKVELIARMRESISVASPTNEPLTEEERAAIEGYENE